MNSKLSTTDLAQSSSDYDSIIRGQLNNAALAQHLRELADSHLQVAHVFADSDSYSLSDKLSNRAFRAELCHKTISFDFHTNLDIKVYKSTMHCRDRFCFNCAKLLSHTREQKFVSFLNSVNSDYDFYLATFTHPNSVDGDVNPTDARLSLSSSIARMKLSFTKLNNYLKCKSKDTKSWLGFDKLGYVGAIRSFECTYRSHLHYSEFHPHFHVIFAFNHGLDLTEKHVNDFSFSRFNPNKITLFSDLEITLQKLWYLLINNIRIDKQNFDSLPQGYSCQCKLITDNNYHQAFKYPFKPELPEIMPFHTFLSLNSNLHSMRIVETYGIFRNRGIEDDSIDHSEISLAKYITGSLSALDPSIPISETPKTVKLNIEQQKSLYLSFKLLHQIERQTQNTNTPLTHELLDNILDTLQNLKLSPQQKKDVVSLTLSSYKQLHFNASLFNDNNNNSNDDDFSSLDDIF